jgi:DNA-binding transcriptional MerR regulator
MLISELAQRTGVSVHALRHYERAGLLRPRRLPNGYRDYPGSARREVVFIAMSRALGFGLPRIAENLRAWRSGRAGPGDLADAVQQRVQEIDAQIAALQAQRAQALDHVRWLRARQAERDQASAAAPSSSPPGKTAAPWPRVRRTASPTPPETHHD